MNDDPTGARTWLRISPVGFLKYLKSSQYNRPTHHLWYTRSWIILNFGVKVVDAIYGGLMFQTYQ